MRITMIAFAIRITLVVISLGSPIELAFADSPPTLNAGPSCAAAARGAISLGRDMEACMGDERAAQDLLTKNWAQYAPADKTQCVSMAARGGPQSYVELISCLETMTYAAAIHKADSRPGMVDKNAKANTPNQSANHSLR
jgi:hypothetical protein